MFVWCGNRRYHDPRSRSLTALEAAAPAGGQAAVLPPPLIIWSCCSRTFLLLVILFLRCSSSYKSLILTWLSKSPASLTSKTSKTHDLRRVTWSSWCKHLKPGMSLAKVQTCLTWSMKRSLNCSMNESSGRPFIGQVCKIRISNVNADSDEKIDPVSTVDAVIKFIAQIMAFICLVCVWEFFCSAKAFWLMFVSLRTSATAERRRSRRASKRRKPRKRRGGFLRRGPWRPLCVHKT